MEALISEEESIVYNISELNEEVDNCDDKHLTIEPSVKSESPTKELIKLTFVVTNEEMHISYTKQKELIANALYSHPYFSKIGQVWQTLERGVNYPVIHYVPVNCFNNVEHEFSENNEGEQGLGEDFTIYECLYEEIERIQLPVIAYTGNDCGTSYKSSNRRDDVYISSVSYIFVGFKTLDTTFNSVLEDNWKDWTGARSIYLNLSSDFGLSKICFYRRILPNELNTFMYILIAECTNINDKNRILLLDFVDRFRLQRLCGYLTVYSQFLESKNNSISSSFDLSESQSVLEVINHEITSDSHSSSITPIDI